MRVAQFQPCHPPKSSNRLCCVPRPYTRVGRVLLNAESPPQARVRMASSPSSNRSITESKSMSCPSAAIVHSRARGCGASRRTRGGAATRVGKERLWADDRNARRAQAGKARWSAAVARTRTRPSSSQSAQAARPCLACRGRGKVGRAGPPNSPERAARRLAGSYGSTEVDRATHKSGRAVYGASDGEVEPGWEDTAGGGRLDARGRDKRWAG